jgi:hypothetical protein
MQFLMITTIVVVTTFGFLTEGNKAMKSLGWLPDPLGFLPEILGMIAVVMVIVLGVRSRFQFVRPGYWFTFGALLIGILCGIFANSVEPGPIFAGIRYYLRAIPMFFVPAVFLFTERQVRTQLYVLLGIAIVQFPLAVYQRILTRGMGEYTGDWTSGTLMISSIMSTYLIWCVCIAAGFFLRKRLTTGTFLVLTLLLLAPTTINETKGTVVLLPLGLMVVFLIGSQAGTRGKNLLVATGTLILFGAIFVPIYDYFIADKPQGHTLGTFLDPDRTEHYLLKGSEIGDTGKARRGDGIIVPLKSLSRDPVKLVFGLGIGNASHSQLGESFTGRYYDMYAPFLLHQFAKFVLEIGLMGTFLVLVLFWLVFRDCIAVAQRSNDVKGILALGWTGVTAIMVIGIFYKEYAYFDSISFLFWFYAGVIAAERVRLARTETNEPAVAQSVLKAGRARVSPNYSHTLS